MGALSESVIFPRGDKIPEQYSKYFVGTAYLRMLVEAAANSIARSAT